VTKIKSYTKLKQFVKIIFGKNVAESMGNYHKDYLVLYQKLIETV